MIILIFVGTRNATSITPVITIGNNMSEIAGKAEKACTFLGQVALVAGKFSNTKEGRTAMMWAAWMWATKIAQVSSLVAVPSLSTAALTIAFICSTAYGIQTVVGVDTFGGAEFLNYANTWCVRAFSVVLPASFLPLRDQDLEEMKGKLDYVINFLEAMKKAGG